MTRSPTISTSFVCSSTVWIGWIMEQWTALARVAHSARFSISGATSIPMNKQIPKDELLTPAASGPHSGSHMQHHHSSSSPLLQLVFRPQIRFFEQQRQEHKLGVVLVAISVLFICCHAPSVSTQYRVATYSIEHRQWRETKQQPSMLPGPAVPGCRLVSLFTVIHPLHPLCTLKKITGWRMGMQNVNVAQEME